jgi:predicted MFS family arabinose efflux permease
MKNMHSTHSQPMAIAPLPVPAEALSTALTLLLAGIAGLAVATLYYTQPMLALMGTSLGASTAAIGLVPMLTQLGYAAGLLFLAPLGDRIDRRRIIVIKAVVLTGALAIGAAAPGIDLLLAASFVVGLAATLAQDVVSSAATLAPGHHRGRVVGSVMTGLLLGILLSRTVAGVVGERFGWRSMLAMAAASTALVAVVAARGLPRIQPTTHLAYAALMRSLGRLWRRHPALRRAALAQGLLAIGFSAFWSSLALMLSGEPFHLGSSVAGAFGLAGAAGALAAPLAGRLADRFGPEVVTRLGTALAAAAFAAMIFATRLSPHAQLVVLAVAVVGFDLGVQATLIAHQTIVYALEPGARSRLNAVLFTVMFVGMAAGAGLGSLLLARWGWTGVTVLATASAVGALLVRLFGAERSTAAGADEARIAAA